MESTRQGSNPVFPPVSQPSVQNIEACPKCHLPIKQADYFCANCGANLRLKPPSTSIGKLTELVLGSVFLPPMGIIWGFRYLKHKDKKSKTVGIALIALTIVVLIVVVKISIDTINKVNEQVSSQLNNMQSF